MVLKARNGNSQNDPIVYLQGGPGGATLSGFNTWINSPLRQDRDFVLIDQRGTGFSAAMCSSLSTELLNILAKDYTLEEEAKAMQRAVADCKKALRSTGVDQAGYNTH